MTEAIPLTPSFMQTDDKLAQRARLRKAIRDCISEQSSLDRKRSQSIRICLTAEEYAQILSSCQGTPASVYCRAKVLGDSVPHAKKQIPEINRQVLNELLRLGNNINQIARGINQAGLKGESPTLAPVWLSQLAELKSLLQETNLAILGLGKD